MADRVRELEVKIGGEPWTLRFVSRREICKKTWGICDRHNKVILVREDLSDQNLLDTLIHEIRHAQHPILFEAEEFIDSTSTEIARIILDTNRYVRK